VRTAEWTDAVSVLDRVTAVFEAFTEDDEGLGVSELARRAHLPKSTVSRIAADLVAQRLLDREGDKLFLGVRLFELGQSAQQPRALRQIAVPVMTDLRDATGQTVHLAVREGADVVIIALVRGELTAKPLARVGGRLPAHTTALGKAILAFSPPDTVESIAHGGHGQAVVRTATDSIVLLDELSAIRRSGMALEREDGATPHSCAACPVLGFGGVPLAAISVSGSFGAVVPDRTGPALRAAATTLSRRMSGGKAH